VADGTVHLEVRALGKSFGATRALHDVSIAVQAGSVHAFVGENGAGKSTLGKIIAGGTPGGAFGGRADIMSLYDPTIGARIPQSGTFNGNPLVSAAGLASLTEVMTPAAYTQLARLGARLAAGCQAAIDANGIPAHTVDLGAKGCVSFRKERSRNYRDFLATKPELFGAAFPWAINRGVFMTPGDEEQWTISVQHTEDDIRTYVNAFGEFCAELAK